MQQIRFRLGLCPRPHWGACSAPRSLAGAGLGPTSKGREGGRERQRNGRKGGKGKGREGRGGLENGEDHSRTWTPPTFLTD